MDNNDLKLNDKDANADTRIEENDFLQKKKPRQKTPRKDKPSTWARAKKLEKAKQIKQAKKDKKTKESITQNYHNCNVEQAYSIPDKKQAWLDVENEIRLYVQEQTIKDLREENNLLAIKNKNLQLENDKLSNSWLTTQFQNERLKSQLDSLEVNKVFTRNNDKIEITNQFVKHDINEVLNDKCPICLDTYSQGYTLTKCCKHPIHYGCGYNCVVITPKKCPLCNNTETLPISNPKDLNSNQILYDNNGNPLMQDMTYRYVNPNYPVITKACIPKFNNCPEFTHRLNTDFEIGPNALEPRNPSFWKSMFYENLCSWCCINNKKSLLSEKCSQTTKPHSFHYDCRAKVIEERLKYGSGETLDPQHHKYLYRCVPTCTGHIKIV